MHGNTIQRYFKILKVNYHLTIKINLFLSIIFLCITPIIRGISNLDSFFSAECLEKTVALIGIILITPLTSKEHNSQIKDIVSIRKIKNSKILLLRWIIAEIIVLISIVSFTIVMKATNCTFNYLPYVFGTIVTASFLGIIGLLFSTLTKNVVIGYLFSVGIYMINLFGAIDIHSKLYLFSMTEGKFEAKYILALLTVIIFTITNLLW